MSKTQRIEDLENLCREAGIPEFLIENPGFIKGEPITKKDIEWGKKAIEIYKARFEPRDKGNKELFAGDASQVIAQLVDSKKGTELVRALFKSGNLKLVIENGNFKITYSIPKK